MDELHSDSKKKVLEQIMQLMDDKMTGDLQSKSPKMSMLEVDAKPVEGEPKLMGKEEMPKMDEMSSDDGDEMSEDDKMKLKELYEKYC